MVMSVMVMSVMVLSTNGPNKPGSVYSNVKTVLPGERVSLSVPPRSLPTWSQKLAARPNTLYAATKWPSIFYCPLNKPQQPTDTQTERRYG